MTRLTAGLCSFLVFCSAFADEVKDAPPPATTDVVGITIFFLLFLGLGVGFFAYVYWRHKNNQED